MTVIGTGYASSVSGTCLAEMGNKVTYVDVDRAKIDRLLNSGIPIYEPRLEDLIKRNVAYDRLHLTADITKISGDTEAVFSAVGTPPDEDGSVDLKYVLIVAREFGQSINKYTILVTKSTVPVGTVKKVKAVIREEPDKRDVNVPFGVVSNPEFLRRGAVIEDSVSPNRVVIGVENKQVEEVVTKLYHSFLIQNFRVIFMDVPSVEMTKYAVNAMLATRISLMSDIANLCERTGANVDNVRKGIGTDARIGQKFLHAGCGYGDSCFPKDVKVLIHPGVDNGYHMGMVKTIERVNESQKTTVYNRFSMLMENAKDKTTAVFGLAFKPETDDMHETPVLVAVERLLEADISVWVLNLVAMPEYKRRIGNVVTYYESMHDAADGVDALALMTEWRQLHIPIWNVTKKCMKDNVIVDGRNIYNHQEFKGLGFVYIRIGEKWKLHSVMLTI